MARAATSLRPLLFGLPQLGVNHELPDRFGIADNVMVITEMLGRQGGTKIWVRGLQNIYQEVALFVRETVVRRLAARLVSQCLNAVAFHGPGQAHHVTFGVGKKRGGVATRDLSPDEPLNNIGAVEFSLRERIEGCRHTPLLNRTLLIYSG